MTHVLQRIAYVVRTVVQVRCTCWIILIEGGLLWLAKHTERARRIRNSELASTLPATDSTTVDATCLIRMTGAKIFGRNITRDSNGTFDGNRDRSIVVQPGHHQLERHVRKLLLDVGGVVEVDNSRGCGDVESI